MTDYFPHVHKTIFSLTFLALIFSTVLMAAVDRYAFSSPLAQQRFDNLINHLRCLVCQNQSLAESHAPLAEDLRDQIYQMIEQGKKDKDITDYLVFRYGDFILFDPPLTKLTYLLWFGPLALLIIGGCVLYSFIKRRT